MEQRRRPYILLAARAAALAGVGAGGADMEQTAEAIRQRDPEAAGAMIGWSAQLHLDHITQGGDPFEMLEARPLDFGHWSAHRLEALSEFELRHGEAVAIGVALDTLYSSLVHGLDPADAERVVTCLQRLGFDLYHPQLEAPEALFAGLEEFRQHLGGRLTLTMLARIGQSFEVHAVDQDRMRIAMGRLIEFSTSSSRR